MPPASPDHDVLRFENFELHLRAGELYKGGHKIRLQALPLRILAALLATPGQVVTRDELREKLWPADTFVDFDHSLNTAIRKLRRALNDAAGTPRFIETLPRRGYRFVGAAPKVNLAAPSAPPAPSGPPEMAAPANDLVGGVFVLGGESGSNFVSLPADDVALQEKEKLEAANDDLGLSLLFAARKLFLVPSGTRVKVLKSVPAVFCREVRILEGEFIGETALAPLKCLLETA
ncbi:MAG: winged helix-turn-helix domain-containing protein [Candidatus Acidiferrales bacterium]